MTLALEPPPVPLKADPDGVVRIAGTRVTLDTVVAAFTEGATAEEIARQYPVLDLADVYSVIGFYLARKDDVDAYLADRQAQSDRVRRENESRFSPIGVRDRLLARRAAQGGRQ